MTISIGLSRDDRALQQAKKTGRNRVCDYQALVQSGEIEQPNYDASELF